MPRTIRRVVTGHDASGRSIVVSDGEPPFVLRTPDLNLGTTEVWATDAPPSIPVPHDDPTAAHPHDLPSVGGSRFRIVELPPEGQLVVEGGDAAAGLAAYAAHSPGIVAGMKPDNPGMHVTDTVDYGIVISGRVALELDGGVKVDLAPGDCVVQNATMHAWRTIGDEPCVMAFVMIGATRG